MSRRTEHVVRQSLQHVSHVAQNEVIPRGGFHPLSRLREYFESRLLRADQ